MGDDFRPPQALERRAHSGYPRCFGKRPLYENKRSLAKLSNRTLSKHACIVFDCRFGNSAEANGSNRSPRIVWLDRSALRNSFQRFDVSNKINV
jgi:hypothetical protein